MCGWMSGLIGSPAQLSEKQNDEKDPQNERTAGLQGGSQVHAQPPDSADGAAAGWNTPNGAKYMNEAQACLPSLILRIQARRDAQRGHGRLSFIVRGCCVIFWLFRVDFFVFWFL